MGAPYHPATNGQAERYVQTIKSKLKALGKDKIDINIALQSILLLLQKNDPSSYGENNHL